MASDQQSTGPKPRKHTGSGGILARGGKGATIRRCGNVVDVGRCVFWFGHGAVYARLT
jgi:hypothetical protein